MSWGVQGLEVRYGRRVAVRGVGFDLAPRTVTALVGGDGAGKTTTLRALAGAVRPAAGRVFTPDRRRIGYLPAGSGVYPDLTVAENLAFVGRAYGLTGSGLRARADRLLARTGLSEARDRLAGRLSGGMRRKLALACALLHDPELLILDEATTGVDPVSRAELWRLLTRAVADGAAVALSTAYLDEAERAGTVVVLRRGRQLAAGAPDTLVAAMPGAVLTADTRPDGLPAWRSGRRWRAWASRGQAAPGTRRVPARLEDAMIVATLAEEPSPAEAS